MSAEQVSESLKISYHSALCVLTINNPPYNALSIDLMNTLERMIPELANDQSVRAILVTAEGDQNFSVGMDLKQLAPIFNDQSKLEALFDQRLNVLSMIENLNKPVIATLFGHCLGGGLELPLACHFRLAAKTGCKIGLPEMDLGTVPAWGGSVRLTKTVGRMHATDMILRAKKIDGEEAYRIGLVNEVVENHRLLDRAMELGLELAQAPAYAVSQILPALKAIEDMNVDKGFAMERRAVMNTLGSPENQEGTMAFIQKRKPAFV